MHYRANSLSSGFTSQADDPDFFLSPAGKRSPHAELIATLEAIQRPGGGDAHPRCRFPARDRWLRQLAVVLASEWRQQRMELPLDALVVDASFSGFRAITRKKLDSFWLTWPLQVPLSWTIPANYEAIDRIGAIAPTPIMIIHSINDMIIPFHHGPELYAAAGEPKVFLRTDTPHAATFIIPAYRDAVLDFLKRSSTPQR